MEESIKFEKKQMDVLKEEVLICDRELEHYRKEKAETTREYLDNQVRISHKELKPILWHHYGNDDHSFGLQVNRLMNDLTVEDSSLAQAEHQICSNDTDIELYKMKINKAISTDIDFQAEMLR